MAAKAVPYTPRPYAAPAFEQDRGRLIDLVRARGLAQAEAIRRSGDLSGNLWAGVGQNIAGTLGEIARGQQFQQQRAAQLAFEQQKAAEAIAIRREEMGARQEAARLAAEDKQQVRERQIATDLQPGVLAGEGLVAARSYPATAGRVEILDGVPVLRRTDAQATAAKSAESLAADRAATNARLSEPKPVTPPNVGSFEDYVTYKYGPRPTDQQIESARRAYSDTGRQLPPTQAPGTLPAPTQRRVDMKVRAFEALPAVKKAQVMADSVGFAQSLDTNTKNPADDQALIYAFAKAMDPESVVREGEYATVQKYAQSWAQSMGFNAARIFSNSTFLTPEARSNMKSTILTRFGSAKKQYDAMRKSYTENINKITGQDDGDSYLTDYGSAFPADAAGKPKPNPNR